MQTHTDIIKKDGESDHKEFFKKHDEIVEKYKDEYKQHWKELHGRQGNYFLSINGSYKYGSSDVQLYVEEFKLMKHLHMPSKSILHLAATPNQGIFLKKFQEKKWSVTVYNYNEDAVETLSSKGMIAKLIDLDKRDPKTQDIVYKTELEKDLTKPTNIFCIHILEYLSSSSINALLTYLMECAKPGSVFFIANYVPNKDAPSEAKDFLPRNYVSSFFKKRLDMEINFQITQENQSPVSKKYVTSEILVVTKIKPK